jgi:hypothetical protein
VRIVEEILLIQVRIIRHKPTQKNQQEEKKQSFGFFRVRKKAKLRKEIVESQQNGVLDRSTHTNKRREQLGFVSERASDRSSERASGLGTTTFVVVVVVVVVAVFVVGGGKEAERSFGLSSSDCGFSGNFAG